MDKLFTVKETMEILKISRAALYVLMKKGSIVYTKIGGKTLFTEADIQHVIDSGKQPVKP